MKTKILILVVALGMFAATPIWAQQRKPDANLMAQLEKRLAESDSKAKGLTGGPKLKWLLRQAEMDKVIDRLKAGQAVDPKEIDITLKGQVN